jgi:hypothetical protein
MLALSVASYFGQFSVFGRSRSSVCRIVTATDGKTIVHIGTSSATCITVASVLHFAAASHRDSRKR